MDANPELTLGEVTTINLTKIEVAHASFKTSFAEKLGFMGSFGMLMKSEVVVLSGQHGYRAHQQNFSTASERP